jgi:glycosyltransferase involved in cell wall biosynthesis
VSKNFVLVGAKPVNDVGQNPGGQLTASSGLLKYARAHGYDLQIINTTQSSFPVPAFHHRLARSIGRAVSLIRSLRNDRVNGVIIFTSAGLSFYERIVLSLVCRLYRVPDLFFVRSGHFLNKAQTSFWARFLARLLLKLPFRIAAQGENWVRFYSSIGVARRRIVLIRNWIPECSNIVNRPKLVNAEHRLHFIFVGWLVQEKGVNEILEAIGMLRPKYSFRFTFVGGGTLEEKLKKHVMQQGWIDDVAVLGWRTANEVDMALSSADVFVLPSYAEGFPNALLEAMSKGIPAICTDVGGIADSLKDGENGFLVPARQAKALADAMQRYLRNPELINMHSQATLQVLRENHEWEANCRKLFSVFDAAIL